MATTINVTTGQSTTSVNLSVGARGPAGTNGSDASVTNANVNAAIEDDADATRTSLGLGDSATRNVGTSAGEVADAEHTHLLDNLDAPGQTPGHVLTPDGIFGVQWRALTPSEVGADPEGSAASAQSAAQSYADTLVVGLVDDRGNFDASINTFPTTGGSGTAGAILKGDLWTIGTIASSGPLQGYGVGCTLRALIDTPGQTASNWAITSVGFGYVPENVTNKSTSVVTDQASNTKYPSVKAVYDWALSVFQGRFGGSLANPSSTTDFAVFDNADGGQPTKVTWTSMLSTMASAVQTLTNKTLTNPTVNNYTEGVVAIGNSGTSQTLSLTNGTVQTCTLTGNCTFTMPTATAGKSFVLYLKTGTGSFTGTFTGVKWAGGTAPTITTTASRMDIISFVADGTNWYGSIMQNFTP